MGILEVGAIICISFEAWMMFNIKDMIAFTTGINELRKRKLPIEETVNLEAQLLVRHVGALGIIGTKVYILYCIILLFTPFRWIGIALIILSIAKSIASKRINPDWLFTWHMADHMFSIAMLSVIVWNR